MFALSLFQMKLVNLDAESNVLFNMILISFNVISFPFPGLPSALLLDWDRVSAGTRDPMQ